MSAEFNVNNPLSRPEWDDMVLASGKGSFFHSSAWARVLTDSYGYKPAYFSFIDGKGLKALAPFMEVNSPITGNRGVCLPFTDYCEPIIEDGCSMGDFISRIIGFGKESGWRYFEIRSVASLAPWPAPSASYYDHVLDISRDEKAILSSFRASTRANIKRAEKEGVNVSMGSSMDYVRRFYELNCMTRKTHGLPPQPFRFFENIQKYILSRGHGIVALADFGGIAVAGDIFFNCGDEVIYKYGASDRKYQRYGANNLVMWEAIKYYASRGGKRFCLGRTDPEHNGLLQFKRGWRGQERAINYYRYDLRRDSCISLSSKIRGFHNKVFSNMPVSILKLSGSLLYKHMG